MQAVVIKTQQGLEHKHCGGRFREMSLHDDWEGMVTCDKCGRRIKFDLVRHWPDGITEIEVENYSRRLVR